MLLFYITISFSFFRFSFLPSSYEKQFNFPIKFIEICFIYILILKKKYNHLINLLYEYIRLCDYIILCEYIRLCDYY